MTASTRPLGITLVALSALAYSTAGFFTRLITLDAQTILLYRGIVAGLFIAAFCVVMEGRNALRAAAAIGRPGLLAALCSALATILFINAFRLTSVADVVILFATAPFVTAAISRIVYGVRESRATLIASTLALAGVAIMMGGAGSSRHVLGDLMAIGMTLLMSIMIVIVRQHRQTSMLPGRLTLGFPLRRAGLARRRALPADPARSAAVGAVRHHAVRPRPDPVDRRQPDGLRDRGQP